MTWDKFASGFPLKVDSQGGDVVGTSFGSVCTIFVYIVMFIYAYAKLNVMIDNGDTVVQKKTLDRFYTDDDVTTDKNGFNVAFTLTNYDGSSSVVEDPDYATLEPYYRRFGFEGASSSPIVPLEYRMCEHKDFGLNEDWSRPEQVEVVEEYTEE